MIELQPGNQRSYTSLRGGRHYRTSVSVYRLLTSVEDFRFDQEYLGRLQQGDREVEAHFASYFGPRVVPVAMRLLRSPHLAEDAAQETLWRVLRHFRSGKRIDAPECLPAFVLSTCRHVAFENLRKDRRYRQITDIDPVDSSFDPDLELVNEQRKRLVSEILAKLPERDRQLLLAMLEEGDKSDICRRFGVTQDYLRVLLFRARKRFREALPEERRGESQIRGRGAG